MKPMQAPCASISAAKRPTLGMSVGSERIRAPRLRALAAVASQSATAT